MEGQDQHEQMMYDLAKDATSRRAHSGGDESCWNRLPGVQYGTMDGVTTGHRIDGRRAGQVERKGVNHFSVRAMYVNARDKKKKRKSKRHGHGRRLVTHCLGNTTSANAVCGWSLQLRENAGAARENRASPPSRPVSPPRCRVSVFRLLISFSRGLFHFLLRSFLTASAFCHSFTPPIPSSLLVRRSCKSYSRRAPSYPSFRCAAWSCSSDSLESKWASVRLTMSHLGIPKIAIH